MQIPLPVLDDLCMRFVDNIPDAEVWILLFGDMSFRKTIQFESASKLNKHIGITSTIIAKRIDTQTVLLWHFSNLLNNWSTEAKRLSNTGIM